MIKSLRNSLKNKKISLYTKSIIEDAVINNTTLLGYNVIRKNSVISNSIIGRMTYIGSNSRIVGANIGSFTSIASEVKIIEGNHPTRGFISTHPIFYDKYPAYTLRTNNVFSEFKYVDNEHKYYVMIGSDVWIGYGVKILNGVKIGDGSIIAAGSVIVDDIEAYSIVGGVPGKVIRKRFTDIEIEKLLLMKWWDKDLEWISQNAHLFGNIKEIDKL